MSSTDLRLLSRFIAVAEEGSINRAASRLNLSQPALSKGLQLLEERFNVPLMDRGPQGVQLTSFGHLLFRHAKWIEAEFRKLDGEMEALRTLAVGEVRIGVPTGLSFSAILSTATRRLDRPDARLNFSYMLGTREALIQPLIAGDLDFIITVFDEGNVIEELTQVPLFTDRNILVVGAHHPLAARRVVPLAEIMDWSWTVRSESSDFETMLRNNREGLQHRRSIMRSNSVLFVKSLVFDGDWIGLINHGAVDEELADGRAIELRLEPDKGGEGLANRHQVGIAYRRNSSLSTASTMLIEQIRLAIAEKG